MSKFWNGPKFWSQLRWSLIVVLLDLAPIIPIVLLRMRSSHFIPGDLYYAMSLGFFLIYSIGGRIKICRHYNFSWVWAVLSGTLELTWVVILADVTPPFIEFTVIDWVGCPFSLLSLQYVILDIIEDCI